MTLLLHLRIAGALLLGLAAFHFVLPRELNWDEELARLSLLNRQIFLVHTFFLALILTMMGILSFCSNTRVHFAFTVLWGYLSAVYGAALWAQLR